MNQPVAVLDANVLVPVLVCDLLLSMFDAELFQPAVSPTILEEVERSLIVDFPRLDPDGPRRRADGMARALALHVHDVTQENDAALAGINRKDRHVAALALTQHVDLVVTNDRRLRRQRYTIDGRHRSKSFRTRIEADRYRGLLLQAVQAGGRFDETTGEPESWQTPLAEARVHEWSRRWLGEQWQEWHRELGRRRPRLLPGSSRSPSSTVQSHRTVCASILLRLVTQH